MTFQLKMAEQSLLKLATKISLETTQLKKHRHILFLSDTATKYLKCSIWIIHTYFASIKLANLYTIIQIKL